MRTLSRRILTALLSLATCLALAYGLFGIGFVACTTPQATKAIGNTFSGWEHSVFPAEDMETIAEAARSFSIEGTPSKDLYDTIFAAIEKNQPALAHIITIGSVEEALTSYSGTEGDVSQYESSSLTRLMEQYSLPHDALSHLQDCTPLFATGRISTGVIFTLGIIGLVALGFLCGRRRAGATMMASSLLVILILVALAIWAFVDFYSLFVLMHELLFAQGNWTFPSDSLLIQLFPEAFWAAMAVLWVGISILCSLVFLLIGKLLMR